jgi:hypothetical protein
MQRVLVLSVFMVSSFAVASNPSSANLIPIKSLCFSSKDVQLYTHESVLPDNAAEDIFQLVNDKLDIYHIPHEPCGSLVNHLLNVQVTLARLEDHSRIYILFIDIFDKLPYIYKGVVSIYNVSDYGEETPLPDTSLDALKSVIGERLSELGANFVKAHSPKSP